MATSSADGGRLPNEVLARAVAESAAAVTVADARAPDLPLVYVNAAFERVTGHRRDDVLGRNCRVVQGPHRDEGPLSEVRRALAARRPARVRLLNRRPTGEDWWNELHLSFVRDDAGSVTHVLGLQHDVTDQVLEQRVLAELAYQDPLTGLPNRRELEQHLALALARAERSGTAVGVLLLDLDGFKAVNDVHGHEAGDELLRQLGARLRSAVRSTDLVSRLGGDEFVVLLADLAPDEAAAATETVVAQVCRGLEHGFSLTSASASVPVTASIGTAVYPVQGATALELLRAADVDMYRRKARLSPDVPDGP